MHHLHQRLKALSYWSTNSKKEHRKMFAMLPLFFVLFLYAASIRSTKSCNIPP